MPPLDPSELAGARWWAAWAIIAVLVPFLLREAYCVWKGKPTLTRSFRHTILRRRWATYTAAALFAWGFYHLMVQRHGTRSFDHDDLVALAAGVIAGEWVYRRHNAAKQEGA